nr:hypothetical protein [Thermoproteota archaeon]
VDSNSNGLNLANKYAKPRPKSTGRFLSPGNRDINAIKRNPYKQTNQHGYKPVSPLGPAGTYTTWKGTTSEPFKVGVNHVEGQLLCFAANGTPNLIKHFVRNFTGIQANSGVPITYTLQH